MDILSIPVNQPWKLFPATLDEFKLKMREFRSQYALRANTDPTANKILTHINAIATYWEENPDARAKGALSVQIIEGLGLMENHSDRVVFKFEREKCKGVQWNMIKGGSNVQFKYPDDRFRTEFYPMFP